MNVQTTGFKGHWLALLLMAPMAACGQQDSAPTDTAVHLAETQQGDLTEIMARGEALYLSNCAACHQPTGAAVCGDP